MVHLSERVLNALADGELPKAEAEAARHHLHACSRCAARFADLVATDQEIAALLGTLDTPPPVLQPAEVIARARGRFRRPALVRAAGIAAVLVAGAAAAAVPGAPLHRYLARVLAESSPSRAPAPPAPSSSPVSESSSGIRFVPAEEIEVVFRDAQQPGVIRIALNHGDTLRITHTGGDVAYLLDDARVMVDNPTANASYRISLPERLRRARIRVGDRTVFAKDAARISTDAVPAAGGAYLLPSADIAKSRKSRAAATADP